VTLDHTVLPPPGRRQPSETDEQHAIDYLFELIASIGGSMLTALEKET
jgi:hypothetical protein